MTTTTGKPKIRVLAGLGENFGVVHARERDLSLKQGLDSDRQVLWEEKVFAEPRLVRKNGPGETDTSLLASLCCPILRRLLTRASGSTCGGVAAPGSCMLTMRTGRGVEWVCAVLDIYLVSRFIADIAGLVATGRWQGGAKIVTVCRASRARGPLGNQARCVRSQ